MFDKRDSGWCQPHDDHAADDRAAGFASATLRVAAAKKPPTNAQLERHIENMERALVECYRRIQYLTDRVAGYRRPQAMQDYLDHLSSQPASDEVATDVSARLLARLSAGLVE